MARKRTRKVQQFILSLFGLLIVGYFVYHTIQGDRGWFAMIRMEHEVAQASARLEKLQQEREMLEHKTKLLNAKSLDPDLLEEKSRELLNYSKPNEIVILTPSISNTEKNAEKNKDKLSK